MQQDEESLRKSLIVSTCLHAAIMLGLYFGMPNFFKPPPVMSWHPVPVDIVEIGAITNTHIQNTPEGQINGTPKAADKPLDKPEPPAPPPPAPKPQDVPKPPEPKPEPPKPEVKAEAKAAPTPEVDDAALPKPQAKPKPPEPAKAQAAPKPDDLTSVLKNVAKLKATAPKNENEGKKPTDVKDSRAAQSNATGEAKIEGGGKPGPASGGGFGPALSDRLTISQEDSLRRQIGSCWNMPVGARNAADLIVEVLIEVNPDRTVRSAQVVDQARLASDPYFRSAAESALRALHHPKCSPLELPPDQYEQWKTIRFNFDPRDMI